MYEGPDYFFRGSHLRAYEHRFGAPGIIVTFDHWRRSRVGFPSPRRGLNFCKRGYDHIRIDSRANDWFMNPDLDPVLARVAQRLDTYDRVVFLGFSMGAFCALKLARHRQPDRLIAVSPSYPKDDTASPALQSHGPVGLHQGRAIIHYDGSIAQDQRFAKRYAQAVGNGQLVDYPGGGHPATQAVTHKGWYGELLDQWLAPEVCFQALRSIHTVATSERNPHQNVKGLVAKFRALRPKFQPQIGR